MKTRRIHRLGTITCGGAMVVFGSLFIVNTFTNLISYQMILKLWPFILVGMGVELLVSTIREDDFVYDKASVALLFVLTLFSICMAGVDILVRHF